ncbi:MAG: PQQ-binding-like beta-propeller repeat protein, partial [Planctomycetes bacterium]|nr:PQQ-binding-like beta-propeller repeat protein [Planctomycetota bacterium]
AAREFALTLARRCADAGHLLEAESILRETAEAAWHDPAAGDGAARALIQLAELLRHAGVPQDAVPIYRELAKRFPDVRVSDSETAAEHWQRLRDSDQTTRTGWRRFAGWDDSHFRVVRTGGRFLPRRWELAASGDADFLVSYRLRYAQADQRLEIARTGDESVWWSVPLQSLPSRSPNARCALYATGHRLLVLHGGVLHSLDVPHRRVVWTFGLPDPLLRISASVGRRATAHAFSSWNSLMASAGLLERSRAERAVVFVGARHVCLRARRELIVLDVRTGEPVWRLQGLSPQTRLLATDSVVYLIPPERQKAAALRTDDGKPIPVRNLIELLTRALHMSGSEVTVFQTETASVSSSGLPQRRATLKRIDVRSGRLRWRESFAWDLAVAPLDRRHLCVLSGDGSVERFDLVNGRREPLEALSLAAVRSEASPDVAPNKTTSERLQRPASLAALLRTASDRYLVADPDQFYIVVNQRQSSFFSQPLPSVRTHGYLFAYDRHTGRRLWSQRVAQQALVLEQFDLSPYLVFAVQKPKQEGKLSYRSLGILFLDKRDGRAVVRVEVPTYYSNFTSVDVNVAEKYVELRTYNERLRIAASSAPVEPSAD